ncbi:MAG TPA: tetratricopeptide repeat protein [Gemmatimonadaceae bacterium]|nr:tetratricopeptide repeat protein [Gemmatimonadaceae bacterium]
MRPLRAASLVVATLLLATAADAQKKPKEPKRPKMDAGRDTNSAGAYYYWGLGQLQRNPREAENAFYWASRINPSWADPLYAQRIAFHMSNLERFYKYLIGTKYVLKSADVKRADSLYFRAMLRDPFLFRRHDKTLIDRMIEEFTGQYGGFISGDPEMRAWFAYSQTRFPEAIELYAKAIAKKPKDYELHAERARAFYHMARFDSTVAEMNLAIQGYRQEEEKDLVILYESKAMYEYSIANALIQAGELDEAREAFGRALTEDLSFYIAHQRLAALSLIAGDTATAVSEYELAVQLNADDAPLRAEYGAVLVRLGKHAEAEPHLVRAIELEPWYALPYAILADAYEKLGKNAEALAYYKKFLERAAQNDQLRPVAQARATALSASGGK